MENNKLRLGVRLIAPSERKVMGRKSLKNICRLLDRVNEDSPIEEQFLMDLQRSIEITDKKEARIPSQTYKPSGMNCIRSMFYQVIGAEPDEGDSDFRLVGICESGTDRHERIQNAIKGMKDNGIDCEYIDVGDYIKKKKLPIEVVSQEGNETKLYSKKYNISFMSDGIIKYNKKLYIVEFKTEGSYKFSQREYVDAKHYNQGICYSWLLRISDVIFIYINRDTLEMKSFMFTPTDEDKQDIIGLIENCNSYVKKGKVPPKPNDMNCMYCMYKRRCKNARK